jgi:predicted YcjX-like family ATPase
MANIRWLPPIVAEARGWLFKALDRTDLTSGSTVWLAVTGLSRSGKTVLITSLVHNLLSAQHNPNRMTLFKAVGEGRLVAAQIEGAKAHRLPRFPYRHNIEIMAESRPDWPGSTADISEIGIDVHYAPAKSVGKLWASVSGSAAIVSIRIVDYPGEWLLDLPMLTQSFADGRAVRWVAVAWARGPRRRPSFSRIWPSIRTTSWQATKSQSRRTTSIARSCSRPATSTG